MTEQVGGGECDRECEREGECEGEWETSQWVGVTVLVRLQLGEPV